MLRFVGWRGVGKLHNLESQARLHLNRLAIACVWVEVCRECNIVLLQL